MKKLLILTLLLISTAGYACTCVYSEFGIKDYQKADYIVNGKILEVRLDEKRREKVFTFRVGHAIKGKTDKIVEIRTPQDSATCGLNVQKGDQWLLFVNIYNGEWTVSTCDKNVRHNRRKGESKELRKKNCKITETRIKQMKEFKKSSYSEQ